MQSLKSILQNVRYFAPVWVFASLNILLGTWVLYIPYVKDRLNLDDGELGIALFCYALGILVMMPIISTINKHIGVGRYTVLGIILFAISFLFPLFASSYILLCCSLFIVGVFSGSTDISMNALVSEIEKQDGVNFMSAAHGFFSLGGVLGAGIGSALLLGLLEPGAHMLLVAIFIILTNLVLAKNYSKIKEKEAEKVKEKRNYRLTTFIPLIPVAFIAFAILGSEGAIEHWSKLYLLEVIGVNSEKIAGYGFVLFSVTMTLGRFLGDKVSEKFGSDNIIIGGCLIAIFAYLGVLSGELVRSLAGFGLLGLGLSVIIPELFRIASRAKSGTPSANIAFVSGIGFVGFLLGPVVLGGISNWAGLKASFVALLLITIVAILLTFYKKLKTSI